MDLRYPTLVPIAVNEDSRGAHHKFFGKGPASIATPGFDVAEVFMTESHRNVVRGIHLQSPPQPKLITVLTGAIIGNAVCCDPELPEFGTVYSYQLAASDAVKLYIPPLWAQGYRVTENNTRVLYLAGADFSPEGVGFSAFDPALDLEWGDHFDSSFALMADRDRDLPPFAEVVEQLRTVAAVHAAQERNQA